LDATSIETTARPMQSLTPARRKGLKVREAEGFGDAWPEMLAELDRAGVWLSDFPGFGFDWLSKNEDNWTKVAEGKYRNHDERPTVPPRSMTFEDRAAGKEI